MCNKSCAESSSPFKHDKNWFLKRRLDTNMCQVLIDVKYTRDWQLGLKKTLQDWVVIPITFTIQKWSFLSRIYLSMNKSTVFCRYVHIY